MTSSLYEYIWFKIRHDTYATVWLVHETWLWIPNEQFEDGKEYNINQQNTIKIGIMEMEYEIPFKMNSVIHMMKVRILTHGCMTGF